jgi:hypothetical protein
MGLSKEQITDLKSGAEEAILKASKVGVSFDRSWSKQFPSVAGMYVIYEKGEIVYFGETGNINGRMKDLRRTVNHSFRRSLGFMLYGEEATSRKKFSPANEEKLNAYFEKNIQIGFLEVSFGRLEIEEYLVDKYGDQLLNKKKKRK